MGIVLRQSFKNVVATYLGFAIGALNTLSYLLTSFQNHNMAWWCYVTSSATILSPLIAFGVNNTLVRYYTAYQHKEEQAKFNLMLCFFTFAHHCTCYLYWGNRVRTNRSMAFGKEYRSAQLRFAHFSHFSSNSLLWDCLCVDTYTAKNCLWQFPQRSIP